MKTFVIVLIILSLALLIAVIVMAIALCVFQRNIKSHVDKLKKTLDSLNGNINEKIKQTNSLLKSETGLKEENKDLDSLRQEMEVLKKRLNSLALLTEKTHKRYKIMMEQVNDIVELSGMFSGRMELLVKRFLERIQRQKKEREVRQDSVLSEKKENQ